MASTCDEFQPHPWRNRCQKCKETKDKHELSENDIKRLQHHLMSLANADGMELQSDPVYSWLPSECPPDRVEEFFRCFPENLVPKHKSPGVYSRISRLFKQIPLTDISETDGQFVDKECVKDKLTHVKDVIKKKIKFGYVKEWEKGLSEQCPQCLELLKEKELVVLSNGIPFHPACFYCCLCKEFLVDLVHCAELDGGIYCVRHYSENFRKRCGGCDELIFSLEMAEAPRSVFYHRDHLRCFVCDAPLDERAFEEGGQLHCSSCLQKILSAECQGCEKRVSLDHLHVLFENKCWHSECFKCGVCGEVLESFEKRDDKFYCERCFDSKFAPKCTECEVAFKDKEKGIKYKSKMLHTACFRCDNCRKGLGTGPFVPHGDLVYCKGCYLLNFGVRCYVCTYPITDDKALKYDERPYHEGCFVCSKCTVQLGNQPFKRMGEKTYCLKCFGQAFCKKCHFCEEPIVLGEKDVLYSYNEFNWHSGCFLCHSCEKSLEDQAFVMHGTTLICKDCTGEAEAKPGEAEAKPEEAEAKPEESAMTSSEAEGVPSGDEDTEEKDPEGEDVVEENEQEEDVKN